MKRRLFIITHDIFGSETLVAVGVSDKAIAAWIEKHTDIVVDEKFMGLIACPGLGRTMMHDNFSMLRLKDWAGYNRNTAYLAHEAFHLAEFIYDRIGIVHDVRTSGEAFAYFIQSTVEQVLDGLEK